MEYGDLIRIYATISGKLQRSGGYATRTLWMVDRKVCPTFVCLFLIKRDLVQI